VTAEKADKTSGRNGGAELASAQAVTVDEATEVTPELVEALERLVPQLSSSSPPPGHDHLMEIVTSAASILLVARDHTGSIIGSLTLAVFRVPTGRLAWIEDVVVDESARGVGAGEALVAAAVARAVSEGAKSVDLTSRPSRAAANRLYLRAGFEPRDTNVYRFKLEG
jgi:ribosomal protein S18 acetylase RimI-like enzyme